MSKALELAGKEANDMLDLSAAFARFPVPSPPAPDVSAVPGPCTSTATAGAPVVVETPDTCQLADGATTVAATMWLAHRAGVRVFATGGIGGVHRGEPRDASADLTELGQTPPVYMSANIPGGDEHNHELEARYRGRLRRLA